MQKKYFKNREERRLGIIGEVVGEMVKADYHTYKVGTPTQTHILDLSLPLSTKDSFIPNNTDISSGYPILFLFLAHIFKPYILCVHPLELKERSYFNSDIIKNSSCPTESPHWSYSEDRDS